MKDHTQFAEDLALYALGALDAAEVPELETHLRSCAECRDELAALRGDAALLALSTVGPAPPQRARQRLLAAISNEPGKKLASTRLVLGTLRPRWLSFAPIAAALMLAIFSLMLLRVASRLQRRMEQTQAELKDAQQKLDTAERLVKLLNSPESMHVTLVSAREPRPQPQIKAVYSPKMGMLMMMASNLDPLPEHKVYELWLLPVKGDPKPCGTFWPNAKGDAMMDHSLSEAGIDAKGFAITIEPEGGSNTPTLPIRMIGTG